MSVCNTYHEYFMSIALRIATIAKGYTSPNPAVGAIITKNNKIISYGYHPYAGMPHAESFAIEKAKYIPKGSSLWVSLEPCCHYGKTPPCTKAIIDSGIKNVFIATEDPNPIVNGKGIQELLKANINVKCGILKNQAQSINKEYFTYYLKKRPFIRLKFAQTLDAKMANSNYQSKWLSSENTRFFTHRLRAISDAILIGVNTVIHDNPALNIRIANLGNKKFYKIILDPYLKTPVNSILFNDPYPVIIFTNSNSTKQYPNNCEIIQLPLIKNKFNLNEILKILFEKKIQAILIEGGAATISSFIEENLVDELYAVIAPKIMGGINSISFSQQIKEKPINELLLLHSPEIISIDDDIIIKYEFT